MKCVSTNSMLVMAVCVAVAMAAVDSDEWWGNKRARDSDEDWGMKRARGSDEWGLHRKRSQCGRQGDSCFSTEHCCKSFVCAVSDEHEMKPEVPGECLHEKELTPCSTDLDCRTHEHCARLEAISPERYCVARPSAARPQMARLPPSKTGGGALGSQCSDTSDCQAQMSTGERMCCQKVSLGRQGNKQICDRVTASAACISKKK